MRKAVLAIGLIVGLAGCTDGQKAVVSALPVAATVMSPTADAGEKTCAVLQWGVPIAQSRLAQYGPSAQTTVADAQRVIAAGCQLNDATWRQRATAAAGELVNVLYALVQPGA